MCYSAQAWQDYRKFKREFGANLGIKEYIRLFWDWRTKGTPYKFPKAMLDAFSDATEGDELQIRTWIEEWKTEQATVVEQELFAQKTRLVGAERALQTKATKKAQNDQRIATDKISKATLKLKVRSIGRNTNRRKLRSSRTRRATTSSRPTFSANNKSFPWS